MTIKEYRELKGLTQPGLAKELKDIAEGIDAPLISKMERGICDPTPAVQAYIDAQVDSLDDATIELNEQEMRIMMMLMTRAKDRPLTRADLMICTGDNDRVCRRHIESMRLKGIRVCSHSGKEGYWLAKDEDDYRELRGELIKRIKSMSKVLKAMDSVCEGQIVIRDGREKNVC